MLPTRTPAFVGLCVPLKPMQMGAQKVLADASLDDFLVDSRLRGVVCELLERNRWGSTWRGACSHASTELALIGIGRIFTLIPFLQSFHKDPSQIPRVQEQYE